MQARNDFFREDFLKVLQEKHDHWVTHTGIIDDGTRKLTCTQTKKWLNYFYCEGIVLEDGITPGSPYENENRIVNFNKLSESGVHQICYYKRGDVKILFDSFGGVVLQEVRNYLESPIYHNTNIVQGNTTFCGHLCLYVLKSLNNGNTFRDTLNSL